MESTLERPPMSTAERPTPAPDIATSQLAEFSTEELNELSHVLSEVIVELYNLDSQNNPTRQRAIAQRNLIDQKRRALS